MANDFFSLILHFLAALAPYAFVVSNSVTGPRFLFKPTWCGSGLVGSNRGARGEYGVCNFVAFPNVGGVFRAEPKEDPDEDEEEEEEEEDEEEEEEDDEMVVVVAEDGPPAEGKEVGDVPADVPRMGLELLEVDEETAVRNAVNDTVAEVAAVDNIPMSWGSCKSVGSRLLGRSVDSGVGGSRRVPRSTLESIRGRPSPVESILGRVASKLSPLGFGGAELCRSNDTPRGRWVDIMQCSVGLLCFVSWKVLQ